MATAIRDSMEDNSTKDGTNDAIGGAEVDLNPNALADILDGTTAVELGGAGTLDIQNLQATDKSVAAGGVRTALKVRHDPASGTVTDLDGVEVLFQGDDDGGNTTDYGEIEVYFADVSGGTEDAQMVFKVLANNTATALLTLDGPTSEARLDDNVKLTLGTGQDTDISFDATDTVVTMTTGVLSIQGGGITVGVDDTGHDVKFFGATTGKSMLWDESADKLLITGDFEVTGTATGSFGAALTGSTNNTIVTVTGADAIQGEANLTFDGSDLVVADGGGVIVGHTAQVSPQGLTPEFQVLGTSGTDASMALGIWSADASGPFLHFMKSRNATIGGDTIVQDDDELGTFYWGANDGTDDISFAARISAFVDGTPGANDTPGRLVFYTTPDGSQGSTERMRIDSAGNVTKATNCYVSVYNSAVDSAVTGDNTVATIDFDTEIDDIGGNFASDTFTAPVAGKYLVTYKVHTLYITASMDVDLKLVTSNRSYRHYEAVGQPEVWQVKEQAILVDMDASDTLSVTLRCGGSTKTVDIRGAAGSLLETYLMIQLIQ